MAAHERNAKSVCGRFREPFVTKSKAQFKRGFTINVVAEGLLTRKLGVPVCQLGTRLFHHCPATWRIAADLSNCHAMSTRGW